MWILLFIYPRWMRSTVSCGSSGSCDAVFWEAAGEDRQIHDTERMMEYLEDGPEWLDEVPAELFGELIERIIIISPERLKFRLLNGMELAENIERTVR